MMNEGRTYLCIDLKSFYASVECCRRGLDPMTTNLVVADPERSNTTICLAVTPALKKLGVRNRCRVFEIPESIDYIMARPHMRDYMEVSANIYSVYLRYIAPEDMHVYSIDECFIDATPYLSLYGKTPKELAVMLMGAVFAETGITATAGIGTNLFLAKVALDVTAKHAPDNIGVLDEARFREEVWRHRPITDIWNIGSGIARRLARYRVFDLRGVAHMDRDVLYAEFGAGAEYLIDHAWGLEPCTMADIHAYEPSSTSLGNGQILPEDYTWAEARMVLKEMADATVLDLVEKKAATGHVALSVGYASARSEAGAAAFPDGEATGDAGLPTELRRRQAGAKGSVDVGRRGAKGRYGEHAGASRKLSARTNSRDELVSFVDDLYVEITDPARCVRRLNLSFGGLVPEEYADVDLFTDVEALARERDRQDAILAVKRKFGKNALFRGVSLRDKATALERNGMVGGHRA